jgi:hypothetical protein
MPQKRKINRDLVNAALNTSYPKCGGSIPPAQIVRVDFERVECPKCHTRFIPDCRSPTQQKLACRVAGTPRNNRSRSNSNGKGVPNAILEAICTPLRILDFPDFHSPNANSDANREYPQSGNDG